MTEKEKMLAGELYLASDPQLVSERKKRSPDNTAIGAGSVVAKDIPANVFAAGNPCKVVRER